MYTTTSTVVVADSGMCLLVDPGVTAHEVAGLSAAVRQRGWHPVAVWSTHAHWDHLLDGPGLDALPRWSGATAQPGWREQAVAGRDADDALAAVLSLRPDDSPAAVTLRPPQPFPVTSDDGVGAGAIDWQGPQVEVLLHGAHAADHTALVVVDTGVLIAGDLLSDVEIPLLDTRAADPVGDYRAALELVERAAAEHDVQVVVPGHGHVGDLDDLLRRLRQDRRYLDAVASGRPVDDARLTGWLVAVHEQQAAAVRS